MSLQPNSIEMPTTQSYIDQLIQEINDAVEAGSVTNVMVGTIFDYLNRKVLNIEETLLADLFIGTTRVQRMSAAQPLTGISSISFSKRPGGNINPAGNEIGLEIVEVGGQRALHTSLPFYTDSWLSSGGIGDDDSGGGGSLEELDDVDVTGAEAGDTLVFNGECWTAQTLQVSDGDKHYTHRQDAASDSWTITHNLGKFPNVTVIDSANHVVIGNVRYLSENSLIVTFNGIFSGKAYLN